MANVPRRKGSNVTTKTTIARFIYYCKGFDLILELNAFVASNMLHLRVYARMWSGKSNRFTIAFPRKTSRMRLFFFVRFQSCGSFILSETSISNLETNWIFSPRYKFQIPFGREKITDNRESVRGGKFGTGSQKFDLHFPFLRRQILTCFPLTSKNMRFEVLN